MHSAATPHPPRRPEVDPVTALLDSAAVRDAPPAVRTWLERMLRDGERDRQRPRDKKKTAKV